MEALNLNLAHKLKSEHDMGCDDENALFISDFFEPLKRSPERASQYRAVDLSFSNLSNIDLADIINLVGFLPNCNVVNLTGLWLSASAVKSVQELLKKDQILYVIICSTPLASSICSEAFSKFTGDDLEKLVFVDTPKMLEERLWHGIVHKSKQTMVVRTHTRFYNECPSLAAERHWQRGLNSDGTAAPRIASASAKIAEADCEN